MATSTTRTRAKLKLPRYEVPNLITYARAIVQSMTHNPWFPAPSPSLATIEAAIAVLDSAQTATLTRARGTAEVRDEGRRDLVVLLQQLLAQIQATADKNPENSASIIEGTGVFVEKARAVKGRVFTAAAAKVSGSIDLSAPRAARGAAYEWAYSVDAGKTWTSLPVTVKASTTVSGLKPGNRVFFRYRTITKSGTGDWGDVASVIVD